MLSNLTNATSDPEGILRTVNLIVYVLIMAVGIMCNGTLLFIFARHKEVRTTPNTMIFNLAVCDALNLLIVAPLRYEYHYPHGYTQTVDFCRCVSAFHHWILSANALSVLALSIQRFCVTMPNLKFHVRFMYEKTTPVTCVYILFIWMVSLIISLPYGVNWDIYEYLCGDYDDKYADNVMTMANFIFFCLLMPSLMFFFNLVTAKRLKRSLNTPVEINNSNHKIARKRSANVVTVLPVLFVVTHLPYFVWNIYAYYTDVDRYSAQTLIFEYVSKHFLFLNSCFNPIALYMTSRTFRDLSRKYLCCSQVRNSAVSTVQCNCGANSQR